MGEVLDSYIEATQSGRAPKPAPPYIERFGWRAGQRRKIDLAFILLQLFTGKLSDDSAEDLQDLLTPEAHTPDPLDAIFSWLLLKVLKAIGAVRDSPGITQQVLPSHYLPGVSQNFQSGFENITITVFKLSCGSGITPRLAVVL